MKCPDLNPPTHFAVCEKTLLYESFSYNDTTFGGTGGGDPTATSWAASPFSTSTLQIPGSGVYPFYVVPGVSDADAVAMWQVDMGRGVLVARTDSPCNRTAPSMLVVGNGFFNQNNIFRTSAASTYMVITTLRLDNSGTSAGAVIRQAGTNTYYTARIYGSTATVSGSLNTPYSSPTTPLAGW
jgi:hypothetical protein